MQFQAVFGVSVRAFPIFAAIALAACASAPATKRAAEPVASAHAAPAESDLMAKLLAAQFALQSGDLEGGARGFTDAARLSNDAEIAEEATRLSLSVKDWTLAKSALARWQALTPNDIGLVQSRAWIAIGEGNLDAAAGDLEALAARHDDQSWRMIAQTLLAAPDKIAAAKLLDLLSIPAAERNFAALGGNKRIAAGVALPAPSPVFPRYVEPEAKG